MKAEPKFIEGQHPYEHQLRGEAPAKAHAWPGCCGLWLHQLALWLVLCHAEKRKTEKIGERVLWSPLAAAKTALGKCEEEGGGGAAVAGAYDEEVEENFPRKG